MRMAEVRVWFGMLSRCFDEGASGYKNYGGRGITVCEGWRLPAHGLATFLSDMGKRPSDNHSIDRINNDGHYSCGKCGECLANGWPANCRWATRAEQSRNTRRTRRITHNGRTMCLKEWARELNLDYHLLLQRMRHGCTFEQAIQGPLGIKHTVIVESSGEQKCLKDATRDEGLNYKRMSARMRRGQTFDEAKTRPVRQDIVVTAFGVTKKLRDHCRDRCMDIGTVRYRLSQGWTVEDALTKDLHSSNGVVITAFGTTRKLADFCAEHNMNVHTVRERLERGWAPEDALTTPAASHGRVRKVEAFGRTWSMKALAEAYEVDRNVVARRMAEGMTAEDAVLASQQTRQSIKIRAFGKLATLAEHCREHNLAVDVVRKRLRSGQKLEQALSRPDG